MDGRLLEDRAIEKLNMEELEAPEDPATVDLTEIFTEPTAKSAPRPKSKPMPKRPPTPPRGRGTSRSPAASPRGSVGRIPDTRLQLSDKAMEALGRMMSFMLRGWANYRGVTNLDFDPNDGSVNFSEFYDALSERWNGLTLQGKKDVTTRGV